MSDLPVFTIADLEAVPRFDLESFDNADAVALGLAAVEVIRHHGANIAVRIVLGGDAVFVAKLGTTGPGNDPWLAGKAAVAERFGEPSLLVRRRHEAAGTPFDGPDRPRSRCVQSPRRLRPDLRRRRGRRHDHDVGRTRRDRPRARRRDDSALPRRVIALRTGYVRDPS